MGPIWPKRAGHMKNHIYTINSYRSNSNGGKRVGERSDLIFYHNTEPNRPKELAVSVQRDLNYFNRYLLKAINSMDIKRYGLEWEKYDNILYTINPSQIIYIKKPKNRVLLSLKDTNFSTNISLMKGSGEKIRVERYEITHDGVVLILSEGENISTGEEVYYGRDSVKWRNLSSGFSGKIEYLEDRMENKYTVFKVEKKADIYLLNLKGRDRIQEGIDLFINNVKVDYEVKSINTLKGVRLHDNIGPVDFSIVEERNDKFRIYTRRQIIGKLNDSSNRFYVYKMKEGRNNRKGVWIVLKESEENYTSADDDSRTKIDLFFELVSSSSD